MLFPFTGEWNSRNQFDKGTVEIDLPYYYIDFETVLILKPHVDNKQLNTRIFKLIGKHEIKYEKEIFTLCSIETDPFPHIKFILKKNNQKWTGFYQCFGCKDNGT